MTGPTPRSPQNPDAPDVSLAPVVAAAAGSATAVGVRVTHRGRVPARMRITVLGLDSRWVPEPLELGSMQPGEAAEITLTVVPERGALGARYPFAVAVEATPLRGSGTPVLGIAESTLAVDSAERISVSIQPPAPTAVFGKKFHVQITNPGGTDRPLQLLSDSAAGASVRLHRSAVTVPAQRTIAVRGKVRIRRPTILGGENTHTFSVTAQGTGAPEYAEATVRSHPLIGRGARVAVGLVLVVALWVGLAVVFIPKISDAFKPKSLAGAPSTVTSQGPVASGSGGGTGGSGGATTGNGTGGGNGNNGNGNGTGGNGGNGSGGDGEGGGTAQPAGYELSGTVTGPAAKGTTVTLAPTSLASASEAQAAPAPGANSSTVNALRRATTGPLGKVPAQALQSAAGPDAVSKTTDAKGEFRFAGITAPGYYLLTLSHQGFQTQRFLINSTDLASPAPLKVALAPGAGSLAGIVTSSGQGIPAASITITDGTSTLQTSSVSTASERHPTGSWSVNNLSTPGDYLITAGAPGFGSAATLVHLDPSGSATADLTLNPGEGTIVGTISGEDDLGHRGGLGGITVTATNGKQTRTATTVTSQALRGHYILPNLPVPGQYTLTISGAGFLTQTRKVEFTTDVVSATVDATLTRGDAVVSGTVTGQDAHGATQGGLVGVGLTLVSSTATLKTMTTSGDQAGSYRFTGVPPGTYVLTASQYGRSPASSTIEVKAADDQTVDLALRADTGSELPATAHIRGQVVDSRTGGSLTCDRTAVPIAADTCVATITVTAPADPADSSKGTVTYTATSTAALNYLYTVPSLDDPRHPALPPGLYTVTVSAPGYETSTTHVQVAQGQTAPAPTVSLPALSIISGTITTRVGTPAAPSCVIAVPTSTSVPDSTPTSCDPNATGTVCRVPGVGSAPCGLTSMGGSGQGAAGTYQIRGLTHGRYQILVIAQDPEYRYVVGAPPIVQIDVGGDGQFDAVLDRLGRVQLTVLVANRTSGALAPATDATVTIARAPSGKPRSAGTIAPKDNGILTITGLDGSYEVTATANGASDSGQPDPVGLNQTVPLTLVIAAPVGPLVGRVTTTGMDNQPIALVGAQVTITGTVGYDNGIARNGSAVVTTDHNGCYAVLPRGWAADAVPLTSSVCPDPVQQAVVMTDNESGAGTTLTTDRIKIAVAAQGTVTQAYPATDATLSGTDVVRVIPTINVTPQPVPVGELTLTIQGPATGYDAPDLQNAQIQVLNKPGLAGGVSITADPTTPNPNAQSDVSTTLQFTDTSLPVPPGSPAVAMPGRYPLSITLSDFVSARVDLLCPLGAATCTIVKPGSDDARTGSSDIALRRLPDISVTVRAPALPSGQLPDWANGTANLSSGSSLGNLALQVDASDPQVGHVTFDGALTRLARAGGIYKFAIQVDGYGTTSGTVTCGKDYTEPCNLTITLTTLPAFPVSEVTLSSTSSPLGDQSFNPGQVTATISPNPGSSISLSIAQDQAIGPGYYIVWTDTSPGVQEGQVTPVAGGYTIVYRLAGFSDVTATLTCAKGAVVCVQSPANIAMQMLPSPGGTVQLPLAAGASGVDLSQATVTVNSPVSAQQTLKVSLSQPSVNGGTATAALIWDQTPTLPFVGIVQQNTYSITIAVPGYYPTTVAGIDCTAVGMPCTFPNSSTIPLRLYPQPAMGLTILPPAGAPGLTVTGQPVSKPGAPTTIPKVTLTSDASGGLTWSQQGQPTGVVAPGSYTITVATLPGPGYQMLVGGTLTSTNTATFTCNTTSDCTFPSIVLTSPTTLKVLLQDANQNPAGHALLTLDRTGGSPGSGSSPTTSNGTATFANRSTSQVTSSGTDPSYTLAVKADGFAFATGANLLTSSSANVSCSNGSVTVTGLQLIPGGTTTCVVTLTRLGSITGSTAWAQYDLANPANQIGTTAQPGVSVTGTLLAADGSTTSTTFTTESDPNGTYTLAGDSDTEGLTEGTWLISASHDGMADTEGVVAIVSSDGGNTYHLAAVTDNTTGYPALTLAGDPASPTLPLLLVPDRVELDVHLQAGSPLADLPAPAGTTVTLTDSAQTPHTLTCTVTAGTTPGSTEATGCTLEHSGSSAYLAFDSLPPADYTVAVSFAPNTYNPISDQAISLLPTGAAQLIKLSLGAQVSTIKGGIRDINGNAVSSIDGTVELCPWTSTAMSDCAADDFSGNPMTQSLTTSSFTFTNVPNGEYRAVVNAVGYAPAQSGYLGVQYNLQAPSPTVTLQASTRPVTLTLTSRADTSTALDLSGATIVLEPKSSPHQPANTELQIQVNSATGAVNLGQIPTGTWTVLVRHLPGSPFDVTAIGDLSVPDGTGTVTASLPLDQAPVTFTVSWSATDCVTEPAANSTIILPLNQAGDTPVPGSVTATVGSDNTATATVNLPPGTYSLDEDTLALPAGWKLDGTPDDVVIAEPAETPTTEPTIALTAVTTSVPVQWNVNGSKATTAMGGTITATCSAGGTQSFPSTLSAGVGSIDLPPGTWDFAISGTKAAYQVAMPAQTSVPITAGDTVTFDGYSLQPSVAQQDVPGLAATSVTADVAIGNGTETVWHRNNVTVDSDGWPAGTLSVIVPAGSYGLTATVDPTSTDFGDGSSTQDVTVGTGTVTATALPAVLPYLHNGATITVYRPNGSTPAVGATVKLTDADGDAVTCNSPNTTGTDGTISCVGLSASTSYAVAAQWINSGTTYVGHGVLTTGTTGDTTAQASITVVKAPAALVSITGTDGKPFVGATVTLYTNAGAATTISGTTDALGQVFLTGLASGTTYYAIATGSVTDPDTAAVTTLSSPEIQVKTTGSTVVLAASGTLAATVSLPVLVQDSADATPIDSASVSVLSTHGIPLGGGTTIADGTVTIDGLPVTKVNVKASATGYTAGGVNQVTLPVASPPQVIKLVAAP